MTIKNFRELLEERQRLIHKKSIYSELVEHLAKFLDTDTGPTKVGIRSEGDSLVVPQDNVDEERDVFIEAIEKTQELINKIETSMVADNEEKEHEATGIEEPTTEEVPEISAKKPRAKKPG